MVCADCGVTTGWIRTAFNYRKLRKENWFQTLEGRSVIEMLERRYPKDPRVQGWMLREAKKDNLVVSPQWKNDISGLMAAEENGDVQGVSHYNDNLDNPSRPDIVLWEKNGEPDHMGQPRPIQPGLVIAIGQMLDKGYKGKSIDIMNMSFSELMPLYEEWSKTRKYDKDAGEVVHQNEDGWTVRRLTDKDQAYAEGEIMQNCVPRYAPGVEKGTEHIFSLRDPRGQPHANVLMTPSSEGEWDGGTVRDIRGKQNAKPIDEYAGMLRDWFGTFSKQPNWDPNTGPPNDPGPGSADRYGLDDGSGRYSRSQPWIFTSSRWNQSLNKIKNNESLDEFNKWFEEQVWQHVNNKYGHRKNPDTNEWEQYDDFAPYAEWLMKQYRDGEFEPKNGLLPPYLMSAWELNNKIKNSSGTQSQIDEWLDAGNGDHNYDDLGAGNYNIYQNDYSVVGYLREAGYEDLSNKLAEQGYIEAWRLASLPYEALDILYDNCPSSCALEAATTALMRIKNPANVIEDIPGAQALLAANMESAEQESRDITAASELNSPELTYYDLDEDNQTTGRIKNTKIDESFLKGLKIALKSRKGRGLEANLDKIDLDDIAREAAQKAEVERMKSHPGIPIHNFPDGWSMNFIQDADTAKAEGTIMQHCMKDDAYEYPKQIENGLSTHVSLRDKQGMPHATIQLDPKRPRFIDWNEINRQEKKLHQPAQCSNCGGEINESGKCKGCKKQLDVWPWLANYTPEEINKYRAMIEHDQESGIPMPIPPNGWLEGQAVGAPRDETGWRGTGYRYEMDPSEFEKFQQFRKDLQTRGLALPDFRGATVKQVQGKQNTLPEDRYLSHIRSWANSFSDEDRPVGASTGGFHSMPLMHASNVDDMEKGVDELGFSAPHRDVNWNELAFSMHPKKAEFERPAGSSGQLIRPSNLNEDKYPEYSPELGQKTFDYAVGSGQAKNMFEGLARLDKVSQADGASARRHGLPFAARSLYANQALEHLAPQFENYFATADPENYQWAMHGAPAQATINCPNCGNGDVSMCNQCEAQDHLICPDCNTWIPIPGAAPTANQHQGSDNRFGDGWDFFDSPGSQIIKQLLVPASADTCPYNTGVRKAPHNDADGNPCGCLYGGKKQVKPLKAGDPLPDSIVKTADKMNDFLNNPNSRPDLQVPEAQQFLNHLQEHYHTPQTDALMPWLTSQWKNGNILGNYGWSPPGCGLAPGQVQDPAVRHRQDINEVGKYIKENDPDTLKQIPNPMSSSQIANKWVGEHIQRKGKGRFERILHRPVSSDPFSAPSLGITRHSPETDEFYSSYGGIPLTPEDLNHWADWYKSNHPTRRGVNIDDLTAEDFKKKVEEWDDAMRDEAGGAAVHKGETVHHWPDGWTVQRLEGQKPLEEEGDVMGHCIGGYHQQVRDGSHIVYSLRDETNTPQSTIAIMPKRDNSAAKPRDWRPAPEGGVVEQIQGQSNEAPSQEHKDRIKEWAETAFPKDKMPAWQDQQIYDAEDLINSDDDDGYREYHPGDYGFTKPDTDIDWGSIIGDGYDSGFGGWSFDPDDLAKAAVNHDQLPELENTLSSFEDEIQSEQGNQIRHEWDYADSNGKDDMLRNAGLSEWHDAYEREEMPDTQCEECEGTGYIDEGTEEEETCEDCKGTGEREDLFQDWKERDDIAREHYYQEMIDELVEHSWQEDPANEAIAEMERAIFDAGRGKMPRMGARISKSVYHRNYSTGKPCRCGFISHLGLSATSKVIPCHTCGDPTENGICPRCDWGTSTDQSWWDDANTPIPSVKRDIADGIQAKVADWQALGWV